MAVREVLRYYDYSYKTEHTYSSWILRYIKFYGGKTHPKDMGKDEVESFLSYLTEKRDVAAATQKQALNALVFLYRRVLDINLGGGIAPTRSKRRRNLPTVLTQKEVANLLGNMKNINKALWQFIFAELFGVSSQDGTSLMNR